MNDMEPLLVLQTLNLLSNTFYSLILQPTQFCFQTHTPHLSDKIIKFKTLPAVRISSGCVAQGQESVVNKRQQQASLATVIGKYMCGTVNRVVRNKIAAQYALTLV